MARPKNITPKTLLQVEVPIPMASALNLIADQKGVSRAWLVRNVLAEYLELKYGPDLRTAMSKWQRHGNEVMTAFMKETIPAFKELKTPEQQAMDKSTGHDARYEPTNTKAVTREQAAEVAAEGEGMPPLPADPQPWDIPQPEETTVLTQVEKSLSKALAEEMGLEAPRVEDDGGETPKYFPAQYGWEKK